MSGPSRRRHVRIQMSDPQQHKPQTRKKHPSRKLCFDLVELRNRKVILCIIPESEPYTFTTGELTLIRNLIGSVTIQHKDIPYLFRCKSSNNNISNILIGLPDFVKGRVAKKAINHYIKNNVLVVS